MVISGKITDISWVAKLRNSNELEWRRGGSNCLISGEIQPHSLSLLHPHM